MFLLMKDYQTHVFTSTYTADVSGVCSAMFELGGMSILHDPSGCNSTYSTHDEPRWYESHSYMFVSGLDEMTAVLGDDSVLIDDVAAAAADLKPKFITLCGASIPHIIAFDYRGTAHLIEKKTGIPVIPVKTDGLKSYTNGIGLALTAWLKRFADPKERPKTQEVTINLLGVTPLDFSVNGNVEAMKQTFEEAGIKINCTLAMGETFETMQHAFAASVNVVVSSAGRRPATYMKRAAHIPFVEGLPVGKQQTQALIDAIRLAHEIREDQIAYTEEEGSILVIGEEIFAKSLAAAINRLSEDARDGQKAQALWPDENFGLPEEILIDKMRASSRVIADPLYQVVLRGTDKTVFKGFPHEAYSGRIFRRDIPVFACDKYAVEDLLV